MDGQGEGGPFALASHCRTYPDDPFHAHTLELLAHPSRHGLFLTADSPPMPMKGWEVLPTQNMDRRPMRQSGEARRIVVDPQPRIVPIRMNRDVRSRRDEKGFPP